MARRSGLSKFTIAALQAELRDRVVADTKALTEERAALQARLNTVNAELAQLGQSTVSAKPTPQPVAAAAPVAAAPKRKPGRKPAAAPKPKRGRPAATVTASGDGQTLPDLVRTVLEKAREPMAMAAIVEHVRAVYSGNAKSLPTMISAAIKKIRGVKKVSRGVYTLPASAVTTATAAVPVDTSVQILSGSEEVI